MTPREQFDAAMERAVRRWRVLEAVRFGAVRSVLVEDDGNGDDEEEKRGEEDVEMVDAGPVEVVKPCGVVGESVQVWGREVEMIVLDG